MPPGAGEKSAVWLLALFVITLPIVLAQVPQAKTNVREKEKQILDKILQPNLYDRRIRPSGANGTDGPTIVVINLMFRSFPTISDNKMEYSTILTFREEWLDERLKYNDFNGKIKYLTLTDPYKVWMPDLFFSNEREGHFHDIIVPNVYVRIFPNGAVLYSIRISLTLSCPMNLKLYPLDRQTCTLSMISYGWTTEDLVFQWKQVDPVQVARNMHLPRFILEKFQTDLCNSITNTGEYSCLKVNLLFKREFSYYLIQIYIPCCMLVIVSWVSFWLDSNAVPARVSLGVTTLLTMATQTTGINNSLPPVSYTKAIDVWTGVCLTFVFGALLEFALVNYASRSDAHREKLKKQRRQWEMERERDQQALVMEAAAAAAVVESRMDDGSTTFAMKPLPRLRNDGISLDKSRPQHSTYDFHLGIRSSSASNNSNCWRSWISKFPSRSKRIDVISRIIFPVMFALFNLIYWSTYLFREGSEEE
ncbi:glutamate-gated chloride channel-like isoform X2 [Daphnia pulex]|uniref:glutamate-gated chloride channel-like isoform X2 n=1 Tax=Daphnia pulex TaxID=6669 RepID=UPI001EE10D22|nr:glutamate-gated chloride channel-like isoform X2 [Daphnia pulex]